MSPKFQTKLVKQHAHSSARVTTVTTPHGDFTTPTFMPVGTRAAVNCMTAHELTETNSQIILGGNTYHMLVTPGTEFIQNAGGMHRMMAWNKPMLTDSGGYQVFSLSQNSKICKIDENGAKFKHPETGKFILMTPQVSIETQKIIGADIIMAFDQCTPDTGGRAIAELAMERTHRWLLESIETHQKNTQSAYGHEQALFGIVQGGLFKDLREQSLEFLLQQPLDGIAIGGESIGYS
ncbi:MAG: tRNA guanosine(34) transglycosylase Tgt, partial [Pseudomonadota bacterium]